ncbi:MAG TPA: hypothetical protein VE825_01570 [Terriglobales bacterium]|jgi:outer membrane biosynthesis protein TonB|nr:hypothetical protein [Terriglobales bacterium]
MAPFVPRRRIARAALLAAWVGLLFPGSCHRQKPATVPPQSEAPTATAAQPAPPPVPTNSTQPEIRPATPPPVPAMPPRTKKAHPSRKVVPAPPATETPAETPAKTVVPQGGAPSSGSQLTPNLTPEEAERVRQSTVQLLAATQANMDNLSPSLSREEQAMVEEARSYIAQSRAAMGEGDLVRAHNLADKAHQLSNALPKK